MPRNDDTTRRLNPNDTQQIVDTSLAVHGALDAHVGEIVGARYQLLAQIGHGGFGRVYRARDLKLDRIVAVKLMLEVGGTSDHESRVRVLRETRANARLQHPHIVTLHDAGEDSRGLYLILEYVAGTSLEEMLASGPLAPERAAEILRECAEALAAAHSQGIVHRDIKPANILLSEDGHVKIADFGIARLLGESQATDPGSIIGTPNYMAPEQIDGRGVGPAADVFELGCVAYEMIAGRPPFHGETPTEVISRILKGSPDPLPALADTVSPLTDLIYQMLRRSATDRPLPTTIIAQLDQWRADAGVRRLTRRRISVDWRVAVGAIAVVALAGAVFVVRSWRPELAGLTHLPGPARTIVERVKPDQTAPSGSGRTSVTFSNRDNVFRYLEFLGRDRDGVKRLDDLTLQLDGPAREVSLNAEEARFIDAMASHRFDLGHSAFKDGIASDQAVSIAFERITAGELVDLFAWTAGWPVVQRGDFTELSSTFGILKVEARAQPWDTVVAKVLDAAGAEAVQFESIWVVVPKGARVREPLRILGIYQESMPLRKVERAIAALGGTAVVLEDKTSTPPGIIAVAPSREIAAIRRHFANDATSGWRIVEPAVFTGEPVSLRVKGVSSAELAQLAGGSPADGADGRIAVTVSEVPKDELLAVAQATRETFDAASSESTTESKDAHEDAELGLTLSSRPASFYAPLWSLSAGSAFISNDEGTSMMIRGRPDDAESLRRAILAIERMLAPR